MNVFVVRTDVGRLLAIVATVVALSIGLGARAQEASTPVVPASPNTLYCATPLAEASGGSPVSTVVAPTTAASPGGFDPGTPVGLFACGTPDPSSQSTPVATPAE